MQVPAIDEVRDTRLRFVFNDSEILFEYASALTYGDVAHRLEDLPTWRHGDVVEIDVVLGAREPAASASFVGHNSFRP